MIEKMDLDIRNGRIPFFDLIKKKKSKSSFRNKFEMLNRYFKSHGLKLGKITLHKANMEDDIKDFDITYVNNTTNISKVCQTAKEECLLSEVTYNKFRKILAPYATLAPLSKLEKIKKRQNQVFEIQYNSYGHFIKEPIDKITYVCKNFLDKIRKEVPTKSVKDKIFNILISGDGFQLTRTHKNLLNFCFSLVNDGHYYYKGHESFFTLGIFRIQKEDFENISKCLNELIISMKKIKTIIIENEEYKINFMAGGDLKWLALVFGINSANSNYPCPFCKWKNEEIKLLTYDERKNMSKEVVKKTERKIIDKLFDKRNNIRRTQAESALLNDLQDTDKRQGYNNSTLLSFISFENIVVDILHLFLRISDRLLDILFSQLKILQNTYKIYNLIEIFCKFLENDCKISNPSYLFTEEKDGVTVESIKLRSLNSNDRFKMFRKLYGGEVTEEKKVKKKKDNNVTKGVTLSSLFPDQVKDDPMILRLDRIFNEFFIIIKMMKNYKINEKLLIIEKLKDWIKDYLRIETTITPYIHIFVIHLNEFLEKFENINHFSMQGLEKLNYVSKIHYFRQTNKQFRKDNKFTLTLIQKINRLEIIRLNQ